ncbi:hypothetical protein [Caballeronia sp. GAWG1-1]|uniref:hypothetical protein n=1 Tax=Caballeronia sp. GAWG1-1 TaxID=2921742 RepID=UPI0020292D68|nr:hypothetical protein [Caballeronia sp. GAWG1-1]
MKKTISTYWPAAILLPLVLTFCMHAGEPRSAVERHGRSGVASVSAELARAISYGLVDDDDARPNAPARPESI